MREQTERCGEGARALCELPSCKPRLRPSPVSVLFSPVMDGNSGPVQTAPVALVSLVVAWLKGRAAGVRLCPGFCFFPVVYRRTEASHGSARRRRWSALCSTRSPPRRHRPRHAADQRAAVAADSGRAVRGGIKLIEARTHERAATAGPLPASFAGGAGARPDHPISRHRAGGLLRSCSKRLFHFG